MFIDEGWNDIANDIDLAFGRRRYLVEPVSAGAEFVSLHDLGDCWTKSGRAFNIALILFELRVGGKYPIHNIGRSIWYIAIFNPSRSHIVCMIIIKFLRCRFWYWNEAGDCGLGFWLCPASFLCFWISSQCCNCTSGSCHLQSANYFTSYPSNLWPKELE